MLAGTDGAVRAYLSSHAGAGGDDPAPHQGGSADGSELPAIRAAAFYTKGAYEGHAAADGIPRFYHWRKIEGFPLLVIAGAGKAEALSASVWQRNVAAAGCALAVLFSLMMPLMLCREISKRLSHEIELNNEKANLTLANSALEEERENLHALNAEFRQAVQRAEEASTAKSGFLAYMSHEFRTPMHAILAYTKMAQEDIRTEDPSKVEKYIENARTAGLRLLDLLNNLLDFAKLEAGKIELQTGKANFLDIIEGCQRELNSLLEEKRLRVSIAATSNDTGAIVDYARMTQVLINLFSNAIKFSPVGGRIQVELSDSELPGGCPALQCSISDQGMGIPEQELGMIFDRFSQSSTTTRKSSGGTGLGLTICRELVGLHGGHIWAANRPEGGAVFTFTVPREMPEGASAPLRHQPEARRLTAPASAAGTTFHPRCRLNAVRRELRDTLGVSVIIHDQVCAARKRRRQKRVGSRNNRPAGPLSMQVFAKVAATAPAPPIASRSSRLRPVSAASAISINQCATRIYPACRALSR